MENEMSLDYVLAHATFTAKCLYSLCYDVFLEYF